MPLLSVLLNNRAMEKIQGIKPKFGLDAVHPGEAEVHDVDDLLNRRAITTREPFCGRRFHSIS
jgi:hypothetical protein